MNIAIDIRPLLDTHLTGVGEYTYNLITRIIKSDSQHHYFLFYNSFKKPQSLPRFSEKNVTFCEFNYPNKIFNLLLLSQSFNLDTFINQKYNTSIDLFFFPNLSFIQTSNTCKQVVTVHDLSFLINTSWYSTKRKIWHKVIRPQKIIKKSHQIIAVSHNTQRDVAHFYGNSTPCHHILLGIDAIYKPVRDPSVCKNLQRKYQLPKKFILTLSTLEPRKNIITLIEAFNQIDTDHELVIVGGKGWHYKPIHQAYKRSPKKNKIHFTGYIEKSEKPTMYSLADMFIFPSFYEGFGLPPLEAAACGCPVITSTGSSLGEVMEDAALYINPYNTHELIEAIKTIDSNQTLKEELIKKGRHQASSFSWERTAQQTLDLFNQILS